MENRPIRKEPCDKRFPQLKECTFRESFHMTVLSFSGSFPSEGWLSEEDEDLRYMEREFNEIRNDERYTLQKTDASSSGVVDRRRTGSNENLVNLTGKLLFGSAYYKDSPKSEVSLSPAFVTPQRKLNLKKLSEPMSDTRTAKDKGKQSSIATHCSFRSAETLKTREGHRFSLDGGKDDSLSGNRSYWQEEWRISDYAMKPFKSDSAILKSHSKTRPSDTTVLLISANLSTSTSRASDVGTVVQAVHSPCTKQEPLRKLQILDESTENVETEETEGAAIKFVRPKVDLVESSTVATNNGVGITLFDPSWYEHLHSMGVDERFGFFYNFSNFNDPEFNSGYTWNGRGGEFSEGAAAEDDDRDENRWNSSEWNAHIWNGFVIHILSNELDLDNYAVASSYP